MTTKQIWVSTVSPETKKNNCFSLILALNMANNHDIAVAIRPFISGGMASVISSFCMHPFDLTVTRSHSPSLVAEESASGFGVIKMIIKDEGVRGFFSGLSASVLRHGIYGSLKIGVHDHISQRLKKLNGDHPIPFYQKVLSAGLSGSAAAIFGNPFDLVLFRMLNDQCYPTSQRRNYKNPLHAIYRIGKEEGLCQLWR